jgi:hypothetical protein
MMLGELPQKEWGLGEVIRRKEEVSFLVFRACSKVMSVPPAGSVF